MTLKQLLYIPLSFVIMILSMSNAWSQDSYDEKQIQVSLRMIGHQVLLSAGDSTSRVLPIIKNNNRYKIVLDTELELNPDALVESVNKVVADTELADKFIVEVEDCSSGEIVYSYSMNLDEESNIIPCRARNLPLSCYSLLFSLNERDSMMLAQQAILVPLDHNKEDSSLTGGWGLGLLGGVALVLGIWFMMKNNKKEEPEVEDPNVIQLGGSRFDKHSTELIIEDKRIELTAKEADLLILLYDAVNTTIEREVILSKVWGDDGDYVGRTLDVFISKLRKKLEADSTVKIVNIRGVGYKLIARV
ncbi:MAG: winged helix-turn-helix domain-containing protein [Saprospiraceae bacterium]|nr:winged helix-turn-helix domain-containing protein [Saprospiraceae bacterium]